MGKLLLIVNPRSGKTKIKNKLLSIVDIFIKDGWDVQVYVTQEQQDATRAVLRYAETADLLVCSGGDGTLSETISGLIRLKNPPRLGYIPAGSTNDFASSLKIPSNMERAAGCILSGKSRRIDIGRFCTDRYFVYVAGFGAFTEVSYMTPQETKNVLGHQAYVLEGVKSLGNIKAYHMRVESDERSIEGDFIFGMVTNSTSVGGFKGLVPKNTSLDDGMFETLLIEVPKTADKLSNIVAHEYIHRFQTSRIRVCSDEPVDWVLDGEFGGAHTDVTIENVTKSIEITMGAGAGNVSENVKKS